MKINRKQTKNKKYIFVVGGVMSGVGKDGLEKAFLEMFETSYVPTEAVVDRHNPNLEKSMYSMGIQASVSTQWRRAPP